jgi:hypothetical protein
VIRYEWCGFCGAKLYYSQKQLDQRICAPPCPRCGEKDWRDEMDELTAPDQREP